jgi:hypothetical protein
MRLTTIMRMETSEENLVALALAGGADLAIWPLSLG